LVRAAKHVLMVLGARYKEPDMYHVLFVAERGIPAGQVTWEHYSIMTMDAPEIVTEDMESYEYLDIVSEMRSF
jgi:hypothetical protein